jgi:hypothetical protein
MSSYEQKEPSLSSPEVAIQPQTNESTKEQQPTLKSDIKQLDVCLHRQLIMKQTSAEETYHPKRNSYDGEQALAIEVKLAIKQKLANNIPSVESSENSVAEANSKKMKKG